MPTTLTQRQALKMFKDVLHYYFVVDYDVRKLYFNVDYKLFDVGQKLYPFPKGLIVHGARV